MAFEHRKQNLVPFKKFLTRMAKYALFAAGLIIFSMGIGTVGYHHFGNISWLDSFHMSAMILTGMGPVEEMITPAAKIFSSFYALYIHTLKEKMAERWLLSPPTNFLATTIKFT